MFAQLAMPDAVLSHFIEREADDGCLTVEGSKQLDIFFVHPAQWWHDKISVAKNYVVRTPPFSGNKADAYVEYIALGELDSQLGANGDVVRQDYKLVLGNKYSLVARGNTPAAEVIDPSRWRIEGAPPEQWIALDAAIRYVSEVQQTATDPAIKANAEKTLSASVVSLN